MTMYRVLAPTYELTGEVTMKPDGEVRWHRVDFRQLGYAVDMQDALRQFPRGKRYGFSPVLEEVRGLASIVTKRQN